MNKFAQVLYGKVVFTYETLLEKEQLSTIFAPTTFWVDVTGLECEVGYVVGFKEGVGIVLTPPPQKELTFDDIKDRKLEQLKVERDRKEEEPITFDGLTFDFDARSRERINIALIALGAGGSIEWTLADNTSVELQEENLRGVIMVAAQRSNQLHVAYRNAKEKVENALTEEAVNSVTLEV